MAISAPSTGDGRESEDTNGLVKNHQYSLLGCADVINRQGQSVKLLRVRNPWGRFEWDGAFCKESNDWTSN